MIDERELTELLHQAAEGFAVPDHGAERIVEVTAASQPHAARPWWRTHRLAVACAVVIVVVGSTVAIRELTHSNNQPNAQFGQVGRSVGSAATSDGGSGAQNGLAAPAPAPPVVGGDAAGSAGAAGGSAGPAPSSRPVPTQSPVRPLLDTAKVVKTGSVQLEVRRQAVGSTVSQLGSLAGGLGGYVADTKSTDGGDDPTGSVTLRVPAASFEDLLMRVRGLGTVRSSTTHGQDVTAQYSDIQARLTALNATRSQLLTILQKATAIGDVLAVQDRIN
ncbi:MAG TPA: DUF4349 domain-containing protein, partial [Acidimicrobiales bacterium]|nr:DUF4349 domain-containing protein [Acidimicrobiales bacterium]